MYNIMNVSINFVTLSTVNTNKSDISLTCEIFREKRADKKV